MAEHGEEPVSEVEATLDQANPAAIALALGGLRPGAKLAPEAAAFLKKQSRLVDLQIETLQEDRALQHKDRALQHRHLALRYFGDRLRIGLQLLAIAFGLIVASVLAALAWQAHEDKGLVIDTFSVPPDLARDGLSGEVVAARFLDKLQALQKATESERPADSYQHDWGSQIKVEIPQTGLTFGEFERLLRSKLGHASHLTGEVLRTPTGIALTARLGDAPPQTFSGPQSDFDALAQNAAEAVYRASQPYRFAEYLFQHGRGPEAVSVISDLAANGPPSERAWAFAFWGALDMGVNGDPDAARKHLLESVALHSAQWGASAYLENVETWAGHDEKALHYSRLWTDELKAYRGSFSKDRLANFTFQTAGDLAYREGDYLGSARLNLEGAKTPDFFGSRRWFRALAATDYAHDHDPAAARSTIEPLDPNNDLSFLQDDANYGLYAMPSYAIAAARQDWAAALADARACDAWLDARKPTQKLLGFAQQVWVRPLEALALAKTGDMSGAEALIATTPADCYLCVRVRGQIAAVKQDWPTSERWFAEAARQAPSIPFAFSEWGEMRLAKNDLAGAIAKFQIAHQKGPHFADPLELWGEALLRQGDFAGATAKFAEADKYAPRWGRNHMMWGEALARSGKMDEARAQWRAAAAMDLSAADRAELVRAHG